MAEEAASETLWAGNLPMDFNEGMLTSKFGAYGSIKSSQVVRKGRRPQAVIEFSSIEEATFLFENPDALGFDEMPKVQYIKKGTNIGPNGPMKPGQMLPGQGVQGAQPYAAFPGQGQQKGGCKGGLVPGGGGGGGGKGGGGAWTPQGKGDGTARIEDLKRDLQQSRSMPGSQPQPGDPCLWLCGLPPDVTVADLYEIFAPFGRIPLKGVSVMKNDGVCTGVGFVNFMDKVSAETAINRLNGCQMRNGQNLQVAYKFDKKQGGKG